MTWIVEEYVMDSMQTEALILRDEAGGCYAVPLEMLAQCRLSDAVAGQLNAAREVSGYLLTTMFQPLGVAFLAGVSATGGGGGAGKVSFQDIHFVKHVDTSSPILF
jgi:hypothetical protein